MQSVVRGKKIWSNAPASLQVAGRVNEGREGALEGGMAGEEEKKFWMNNLNT